MRPNSPEMPLRSKGPFIKKGNPLSQQKVLNGPLIMASMIKSSPSKVGFGMGTIRGVSSPPPRISRELSSTRSMIRRSSRETLIPQSMKSKESRIEAEEEISSGKNRSREMKLEEEGSSTGEKIEFSVLPSHSVSSTKELAASKKIADVLKKIEKEDFRQPKTSISYFALTNKVNHLPMSYLLSPPFSSGVPGICDSIGPPLVVCLGHNFLDFTPAIETTQIVERSPIGSDRLMDILYVSPHAFTWHARQVLGELPPTLLAVFMITWTQMMHQDSEQAISLFGNADTSKLRLMATIHKIIALLVVFWYFLRFTIPATTTSDKSPVLDLISNAFFIGSLPETTRELQIDTIGASCLVRDTCYMCPLILSIPLFITYCFLHQFSC